MTKTIPSNSQKEAVHRSSETITEGPGGASIAPAPSNRQETEPTPANAGDTNPKGGTHE